ncbi:unnamed protein product [Darwinula stevensoni]|uniref:Peptidase M14 domain-containing protein n=1 Tax=Darwinula stevensoni TaxID=69355 RepID=A0A7R9A4E1_9CRUS|nr:unnamed protein product [Darwinula stevensoni]CAG0884092.1 unnamed protein product [Darwinula stevensoni]
MDESSESGALAHLPDQEIPCNQDPIPIPLLRTTQLLFNSRNDPVARAKELFRLYGPPPDDAPFTFQLPRWPMECQVLPERICHADLPPYQPELFYVASGYEPRPQPVGEDEGIVVYQYLPTCAVNYFCRSSVDGRGVLDDQVLPPLPPPLTRSNTLRFESRFESGNLAKAIRISECFYELHLRADLYTCRHCQWFYFRLENMRSDLVYRFSIVNLSKRDSLYNHGMQPLLYSEKDFVIREVGWQRCGYNIAYFRNNSCEDDDDDVCDTFTLTFNMKFPHDDDTVYLAHCYPYSYSQLQEFLSAVQNDVVRSTFCKQRVFCQSQAGNQVYILTITDRNLQIMDEKKPVVLLTARVHPGETPSSWIMQGIIDYLTSEEPNAKTLREKFMFRIIPMLNPDGVIVGNHRCSLSGKDLNRQYKTVTRDTFPIIWHLKNLIRRLCDETNNYGGQLFLYCDLHGHSRKHNIFMYGCEGKGEGDLSEQIFPLLLSHSAPHMFSFESCRFHIRKEKEGTGRVVTWAMGVKNAYTLEASLGGTTLKGKPGRHFSTCDYKEMGKHFCDAILMLINDDPAKEKLRSRIQAKLTESGSCADFPTQISIEDLHKESEEDTECGESESDNHLSIKKRAMKNKKKKQEMIEKEEALQGLTGMEASKMEQKEEEIVRKKGTSEVGEKKSGKRKKPKGRKLAHVAMGRCVRMAKITNFLALEGSKKKGSRHMHRRVEEITLVSEVDSGSIEMPSIPNFNLPNAKVEGNILMASPSYPKLEEHFSRVLMMRGSSLPSSPQHHLSPSPPKLHTQERAIRRSMIMDARKSSPEPQQPRIPIVKERVKKKEEMFGAAQLPLDYLQIGGSSFMSGNCSSSTLSQQHIRRKRDSASANIHFRDPSNERESPSREELLRRRGISPTFLRNVPSTRLERLSTAPMRPMSPLFPPTSPCQFLTIQDVFPQVVTKHIHPKGGSDYVPFIQPCPSTSGEMQRRNPQRYRQKGSRPAPSSSHTPRSSKKTKKKRSKSSVKKNVLLGKKIP